MGNGEKRNALAQCKVIDLCTCGPMTRATGYCSCEPETVTEKASRLTSNDRQSVYGHPAQDFAKVTGMALALWGRGPESPEEHSLYMVLVKLARLEATPGHHDSIVDAIGYLNTYDMVMQEKVRRLFDTAA